jgi:hypothetical protein
MSFKNSVHTAKKTTLFNNVDQQASPVKEIIAI